MPIEIGVLINNLALKAGIAADNEELKSLLTSPELAAIKVPDNLVTTIESGLLSIDAAKNNHPDIKKKYFADAYDGMDKQLLALVANDTFDEADIEEIKAERSTSKKAEMIVNKLKAAKGKATGADKAEINAQLLALNEQIRLAKAETGSIKGEYEEKIKTIHIDAAKKALFGNYKTIYDELPGNIKTATMDALINQALQDKKAKLANDEHGNLVLVGIDGTNIFGSNNVQLTAQSFLDQSFAPILKVSGTPPAAAKTQAPVVTIPGTAGVDANIKSHNDSVIAAMGNKVSMM